MGKVHLQVADSHYVWNKVTTCVHNLFSNNQRWADQYGEMKIEDITHKITCKLTFVKVSSLRYTRYSRTNMPVQNAVFVVYDTA